MGKFNYIRSNAMRYSINLNKQLNRLIPSYQNGRRFHLFLKALVAPLQILNAKFCIWADEMRVKAMMTSQPILMEWYLNRLFKKYFINAISEFEILSYNRAIVETLHAYLSSETDREYVYGEDEAKGDENSFLMSEIDHQYSFYVYAPMPNAAMISEDEYKAMIGSVLNKYKLASKSYLIIIKYEV